MGTEPGLFSVAATVGRWQLEGRRVTLGRVIDSTGFSSRDAAGAVVAGQEPGGALELSGYLLAGSADTTLRDIFASLEPTDRAVVSVTVTDRDAEQVGLSCGGTVRMLVQPATDIDQDGWTRLAAGEPSCVVTELGSPDPDATPVVGATRLHSPQSLARADLGAEVEQIFARGASGTALVTSNHERLLVTALWPVPSLLIVGDGLIADALITFGNVLGWHSAATDDLSGAVDKINSLRTGDGLIVLSHDLQLAGPALRTALHSPASYIGALGSRRTQSARRDWLIGQGADQQLLARINGPAGLDIGALTPAEIALAITAEMLAARTGRTGTSLRDASGPVHATARARG